MHPESENLAHFAITVLLVSILLGLMTMFVPDMMASMLKLAALILIAFFIVCVLTILPYIGILRAADAYYDWKERRARHERAQQPNPFQGGDQPER